MRMKKWVAFLILLLAGFGAQADFYRWVDMDGRVQYSDQLPPPNIKRVERIKAKGGKPSEPPLPYALQQAVNNFPVTLFSTECGEACTKARELLVKRGIPYTEMDATVQAAQEELKKLTGGPLEVPLLKVGSETLRGFEEHQWNTSLDAAGYPKTASIPPRAPNRPAKPAESAPSGGVPGSQSTQPTPPPETSK